jgi:threonine/homoserine/homoserine lactone efflux protein
MLPMAFVMIAGPQILSSIFLATSENWRRNSIAYISGAALSITAIVTAAFLLSTGAREGGASNDTVSAIILVLLALAAIQTYRKRNESEPPKWMGKLQSATPSFSFKLGFLLLGVFPTDILTSVAVGSYLANQDESWWHCLPFVALTLFFLAIPLLGLLAFGDRAQAFLPKARDWMNDNSWIVSEIVIGLFIVLTIS